AIIVAPGGGMRFLSWEHEGTAVADWLSSRGVTAFVLKYRLMKTPMDPAEFDKAMQGFFAQLQERAAGDPGGNRPTAQDEERPKVGELARADGQQAVKYLRAHAAKWNLSTQRIGMVGFSAGAYVTMRVVMDHDEQSRLNFAAPIYGGETGGRVVPADGPPL